MKIKLCGIIFDVLNKYSYFKEISKNYLVHSEAKHVVYCTEKDLEVERDKAECQNLTPGMLESTVICRKVSEILADYNAFLMHGAVIEYDGKAIAFLAKSGVGKSTHILNWRKTFKEKVKIINGDKPFIQNIDGEFFAFGSPWAGKEGWQRNACAKLKAIVFLSQGKVNACHKIQANQVLDRLFFQINLPKCEAQAMKVMDNLNFMLNTVEIFELTCNKDVNSALVCKKVIMGE